MTDPAPTAVERRKLKKIRDETQYYKHQVSGVRMAYKMGSCLIADEMGLGKSLEALTVAALDFEDGKASRVLVICPASLKWNWENEVHQHTNFTCHVLNGTKDERPKQLAAFKKDILIINYEQVAAHFDQLNAMGFQITIMDEAHYIKSPKAKRTRACQGLQADRFLLLTGSPLLNQVNELWSLLHRVAPGDFGRYYAFLNRYALFGGWKDKQIVGTKNQAELTEKLRSYMIRRRKKDVLDLPVKQIIPVVVEMFPQQKKVYDEAADELRITIPSLPSPMEINNILTRFLRLKQICGTLACIEGLPDISGKLDRVMELVFEILDNGEKVVVYTQFRGVLSNLERRMKERDIPFYQLHGGVPQQQRTPVINAWTNNVKPCVLGAMLQVAGVGFNLTAARKAIFVDKLFVPKMNEQAQDRLHRIGADETQPIQIFELITHNTIEQRVESILKAKTKLFDDLVETSDFKKKLYAELRKTL